MTKLIPYRCNNPDCTREDHYSYFHAEAQGQPTCPECHSSDPDHFEKLAVIHLLIPNPDRSKGQPRMIYGCLGARESKSRPKHLTSLYKAATCKDCLDSNESLAREQAGEDEESVLEEGSTGSPVGSPVVPDAT